MLQNKAIHKNCFCDKDSKNTTIMLREFAHETSGRIHLFAQEIIFVIRGGMHITLENTDMGRQLTKGEFVFIPVGSTLSCRLPGRSTILIVRLTGELPECHVFKINKMADPSQEQYDEIYALKTNERMQHFLGGLLEIMKDGLKCRNYMQMEVGRMLYLIHMYYTQEECTKFFSPVMSPDVGFSEFVRLNWMKYRSVTKLSGAMNMSAQQFANRFRKVFGTTPRTWIQQQRAKLIYRDICKSNKSLKEIAFEHRFSIQANFIRYCRTTFGTSPGQIRKNFLNDNVSF